MGPTGKCCRLHNKSGTCCFIILSHEPRQNDPARIKFPGVPPRFICPSSPSRMSARDRTWPWQRYTFNSLVLEHSQSTINVPTSKHLQPHPEGQTSIDSNQVLRWYVCPPWPHATQKLLAPGIIKWKKQRHFCVNVYIKLVNHNN